MGEKKQNISEDAEEAGEEEEEEKRKRRRGRRRGEGGQRRGGNGKKEKEKAKMSTKLRHTVMPSDDLMAMVEGEREKGKREKRRKWKET